MKLKCSWSGNDICKHGTVKRTLNSLVPFSPHERNFIIVLRRIEVNDLLRHTLNIHSYIGIDFSRMFVYLMWLNLLVHIFDTRIIDLYSLSLLSTQ